MKTYLLKPGVRQVIAKAGETDVAVAYSAAAWIEEHPAGIPQLMVTTPAGTRVPVTVTVTDGVITGQLPNDLLARPGVYSYVFAWTEAGTQLTGGRCEALVLGSDLARDLTHDARRTPDWAERIFLAAGLIEGAVDGVLEARNVAADAAADAEADAEAAQTAREAAEEAQESAEAAAETVEGIMTSMSQTVAAAQQAVDGIEEQKDTMIESIASVAGQGTDETLTQTGVAADAKKAGDAIRSLQGVAGQYARNAGVESADAIADATVKSPSAITAGGFTWTQNGDWHILNIQEGTQATGTSYGIVNWDVKPLLGKGYKMRVEIKSQVVPPAASNRWSILLYSQDALTWSNYIPPVGGNANTIRDRYMPTSMQNAAEGSFVVDFDTDLEGVDVSGYEHVYLLLSMSSGSSSTVRPANTLSVRAYLIPAESTVIATELKGFDQSDYYTKTEIDAKLPMDQTVVCWGDSLTQGSGGDQEKPVSSAGYTYPWQLKQLLGGANVINAGIGGETSWMIASRQGGMQIDVAPCTIPAGTEEIQVTLMGQERNIYDDGSGAVYRADAMPYNINCNSGNAQVNPCSIGGITGNMRHYVAHAGTPDPETGETVATDTYYYYFTRAEAGEEKVLSVPTPLITKAMREYRNAIAIIWIGQNDKIGSVNHPGAAKRARAMVDYMTTNRYIVMCSPSGTDATKTALTEEFILEFGSHFINIRDWLCHYGIGYANEVLGAGITPTDDDTAAIRQGQIPPCLRQNLPTGGKSGTHGNYWYYAGVAKAVYDRGVALGYWE